MYVYARLFVLAFISHFDVYTFRMIFAFLFCLLKTPYSITRPVTSHVFINFSVPGKNNNNT